MSTNRTTIDLGILSFKLSDNFTDGESDFILDTIKQSSIRLEKQVIKADSQAVTVAERTKYNARIFSCDDILEMLEDCNDNIKEFRNIINEGADGDENN